MADAKQLRRWIEEEFGPPRKGDDFSPRAFMAPVERHPIPAFTVYGLLDPRDMSVRYVGCSGGGPLSVHRRVHAHVSQARSRSASAKDAWLAGVLSAGFRPVPFVIEIGHRIEDAALAESHWIQSFRDSGHPLTNKRNSGFPTEPVSRAPSARAVVRTGKEWRRHCAHLKRRRTELSQAKARTDAAIAKLTGPA